MAAELSQAPRTELENRGWEIAAYHNTLETK
jgi:hypothetical protein